MQPFLQLYANDDAEKLGDEMQPFWNFTFFLSFMSQEAKSDPSKPFRLNSQVPVAANSDRMFEGLQAKAKQFWNTLNVHSGSWIAFHNRIHSWTGEMSERAMQNILSLSETSHVRSIPCTLYNL
jgi:hypothetical protein